MTHGTVSRAGAGVLCGLLLCALACSFASSGGTPAADAVVPAAEKPAGPVIKVQTGHAWRINGLAVTPDSRRIVTTSNDQSIRVWDAESGKELPSWVESTVPDITYSTWDYEHVPQSLLPREDFPLVPAGAP